MITPERLRSALHVDEVDLEDLVEVISGHFGGARYVREREIGFPHHGEAIITLRFSKDLDRCDEIVPGPNLVEEMVNDLDKKVTAELLQSTGRRFGTVVLFSIEPVTGFWRYADRLQLRPVPPESPRPPVLYADHPLLLDFEYPGSENPMANARRRQRVATRWAQRLNVLVKPGLTLPSSNARHAWVLVPETDGGALHSQFLQQGYWPEGVVYDESALTRPACDAIERTEAHAYYAAHGTQLEPMKLPTTLDRSVAAIEGLSADSLLRFDHAAYWFNYATNVADSHSVRAVALGATIEAMFEPAETPRCGECGTPKYRPTARFIDFMSAHLPGPDAEGARRLYAELYGFRSRPAHGHVMDYDFLPFHSFMPTRLDEDEKMRALFGFVRVALINWLAERGTAVPEAQVASEV